MTEYLIGTGGWSYFKAPNKSSLKAYSEHFNFVEVNYTFYKYPSCRMVERWRQNTPENFTFTMRCHQDLTHRVGLKPVSNAYIVFDRMMEIHRTLNASFLHLLSPPSYVFDDSRIQDAKDFFSTVNSKRIQLAWEVRSQMTSKLASLMRDFEIVSSVDLSTEEPVWKSDVIYTRLFGKGKHNVYQFTDEELVKIDQKILKAKPRTAIVAYHGVRMNSDASRFKVYKETGRFPTVTEFTGVDSAKAVLQEDAKFPSTKAELIEHQGWKIVDLRSDKRVHLASLLSKLPDKTYSSIQEVLEGLRVRNE